jgi:glycosyltransferase involved in cell wall biosynthesis
MIFISIIIPTYNREKELEICISNFYQSILNNNYVEVIVSNDYKKKEIDESIQLKFPKVIFINGPQKGPAANRNHAANIAKGDWLIFLDDDCLPQSAWFENYEISIRNNISLILEGKTIANSPKQSYDQVSPINLVGGKLWSCNFAIQKKLFFTLNGFDEKYPFSTMEDIDFKERAKLVSNFCFLNESVVVHPWRKRIAFKNFKLRIQSQRYFAVKFEQKNTFHFKMKRIKIFIGSLVSNFIELARFNFKGWLCYIDKMIFNFIMIFI